MPGNMDDARARMLCSAKAEARTKAAGAGTAAPGMLPESRNGRVRRPRRAGEILSKEESIAPATTAASRLSTSSRGAEVKADGRLWATLTKRELRADLARKN
jgi:hypothetical protein